MLTQAERTDAAAKYRRRHQSTRGGKTSLKRILRANRIEAGLRPLTPSRRYTAAQYFRPTTAHGDLVAFLFARRAGLKGLTEGTFARLHPTKGFRFGNAI